MNSYKIRSIMDVIRRGGRLPTDQWGNVLSTDDLLVWFDLQHILSRDERIEVKRELADLIEAEAFMDGWKRVSGGSLDQHVQSEPDSTPVKPASLRGPRIYGGWVMARVYRGARYR